MRIHAARDLDARAWSDNSANDSSAARVQFRIGVTRYSATPEEARRLAADLIAAADDVERTAGEGEP